MRLTIGLLIFSLTAVGLYVILDLWTNVPMEVAVIASLGGGALLEWSFLHFSKERI
ncbi:hypothetical protein [Alkalicoccus daliensis]|uniref:Uncharacterized protein n=1 Tax=Alkalicoccus daliensis TaxID=745820 RepID=A0A1G9ZDG5_9BACI|nr:hypothetical protein [Alkalicoccus daliensis]SDN18666.1 hypothetical protein SAMN04488053_10133 [Alkalicoccus daliensis]